jgi:hypothetical protein
MDIWRLIIEIFLTVTLICNGPVKFLGIGSKIIQNYGIILLLNVLRAAQSVS